MSCATTMTIMFETPSLTVRHLVPEDVDAMAAVYGDADAMRWVGDGSPLDRTGCEKWVEVTFANYRKRGYGMAALELKTSGAVIGFCGIVHPDQQPEPEIKYALLKDYWGQGLASEAVAGMLLYSREQLGLPRVIATVAPENLASQRILIKSGMVETGRRSEDGAEEDVVFETAWDTTQPA